MDPFAPFDVPTLLDALDHSLPTHAFLRDTLFGGPIRTFPTEQVMIEYYVGTRRLAPFVGKYQYGRILLDDGFTSQMLVPPRFGPTRVIRADDLLTRGFGETFGTNRSPTQRAAEIVAKYLEDEELSITRREEWLCAELLLHGKITIDGDDGGRFVVDYGHEINSINTSTNWSDAAAADPISDLQAVSDFIAEQTGMNADLVIMDGASALDFWRSEKVREIMNLRHFIAGAIEPSHEGPGVTFIGELNLPPVELYTYANRYVENLLVDDKWTDVNKPYLPPGTVIVAATEPQGYYAYGAIVQFENTNAAVAYEARRVPFVWVDKDNQLRKIRTSSRPLPVPSNMQSWFVLNTLGQGTALDPNSDFGKFMARWTNPTAQTWPRRSDQLGAAGIKEGGSSGGGGDETRATPRSHGGSHSGPKKE